MERIVLKCCSFFCKRRVLSSIVLPKRSLSRSISSKAGNANGVDDQPVKYTASDAMKFKAKHALMENNTRLWYEPYVVFVSLGIFLLYFTALREENDLDEGIFEPLHNKIIGLEEVQLKTVIEHSKNPEDVAAAKLRLKEIEEP